MRFHVEVVVRLKDGLLDPQGKAIEDSLPQMGWINVSNVRVGKHIEFDIEDPDPEAASAHVEEISDKLLSNPVIESVSYSYRNVVEPGDNRVSLGGGKALKLHVELES